MASHAASTCASRLMRFGASHAGETANVATELTAPASTAPAFPAYCSLMYERRLFQPSSTLQFTPSDLSSATSRERQPTPPNEPKANSNLASTCPSNVISV